MKFTNKVNLDRSKFKFVENEDLIDSIFGLYCPTLLNTPNILSQYPLGY